MSRSIKAGPCAISIAVIAFAAVFAAFNHCALGAVASQTMTPAVHGHCAGHSQPSKPQSNDETPCCKILQALAAQSKANLGYSASSLVLKQYYVDHILLADLSAHDAPSLELDTGPPAAPSFSESVLQRSILAHAPPFLLS
jgi:hypothetical protein